MSTRRNAIGAALIIGFIGGSGWSLLQSPRASAQPAPAATELRRIAEGKAALATRALAALEEMYRIGRLGSDGMPSLVQWNRRLAEARIALANDPAGKVAAAEEFLKKLREFRDQAKRAIDAGFGGASGMTMMEIEYEILDGEAMLAGLKEG